MKRPLFPAYFLITILLLCFTQNLAAQDPPAQQKADLVLVKKSESRLYLMNGKKVIKDFHVVFGENPHGHKQQEGDKRTPEGRYMLDLKKSDSAYYKAIRISYPNKQDTQRAKERGQKPGGQIMIHGQKNGRGWLAPFSRFFNWTDGCIAVTDAEIEEIWSAVDVGTPIEIHP